MFHQKKKFSNQLIQLSDDIDEDSSFGADGINE